MSPLRPLPIVLCLALAACAGGAHPEDAFVAPGKYVLYDCQQLADAEAKFAQRDVELTRLIARARSGAGGDLVAATVYEPEYYSNLGELKDVRREEADKKCAAKSGAKPGTKSGTKSIANAVAVGPQSPDR